MSVYGETRTIIVAPGTAAVRFLHLAGGLVAKAARAMARRHTLHQLGEMDDHMLRDIGLTRSDIRDAAAEPIWRDATQVLVSRSVERRAAVRLRARAGRMG